jgi:pimeloyl-ACP methyl ester carboxylesterase
MSTATPRLLSPLDLLREWRVLVDLAAAARERHAVDTMPRGHAAVMVIPGFGAADGATAVLRRRLGRLGHQVSGWGLGINRGRVETDVPRLLPRFDQLHSASETPVTLVGWSLGGVIAREIARARPGQVREIIALGSPLIGGPKYTFTARWYARQGLDLDRVERKVAEREAANPLPCPMISVYSRRDGMVHYAASIDPGTTDETIEVSCSHLGMCIAPEVLALIARRLAS